MKTSEARQTIFLDIETAPGPEPRLDQFEADKRLKDPEKVAANLEEKKDKAWRSSLLDPFEGEIFCICVAVDDDEVFHFAQTMEQPDSEQIMMIAFDTWLADFSFPRLVGHNIIEFDAHWLFVKGLKYQLKNIVANFMDDSSLKDTMRAMSGPAWKKMTSLDKMSKVLLGHSAKNDVDGSMVFDLLMNGEQQKVINYCKQDVDILRKCYRRLEIFGLV